MSETRIELDLLEREDELATLTSLVAATERGEGSLAVIEGTAGIGKTRLLVETRARAGGSVRVLSARGGELEGEFAFGVVRQLFEPLLATAPPAARAELFSGAATLAVPLFDPAAVAAHQGETDASFAMLHGLYWLAANVASERPTILGLTISTGRIRRRCAGSATSCAGLKGCLCTCSSQCDRRSRVAIRSS